MKRGSVIDVPQATKTAESQKLRLDLIRSIQRNSGENSGQTSCRNDEHTGLDEESPQDHYLSKSSSIEDKVKFARNTFSSTTY